MLGEADVADPLGLRDRAMLEVLYSTGMRRMELAGLHVFDIDSERGTVMVRQGKGKKDRMIPIGERAVAWVRRYIDTVRPQLAVEPDDGTLFLTGMGDAFTPNRLTQLVRNYVRAADLGKSGSCHLFRHTMVTLMLEHGADIRFIQQMLGHADLSTTQIYTQVSIRKLQAIHAMTHPAAKLHRDGGRQDAAAEHDEDAAAELMCSLAAEREQEADEDDGDSRPQDDRDGDAP